MDKEGLVQYDHPTIYSREGKLTLSHVVIHLAMTDRLC